MAVSCESPQVTPINSTPSVETTVESTAKSQKLHGRRFYEKLGSPKFVVAPMVDQSEFAWRLLTRSFMSAERPQSLLAYTPMLHARMMTETPQFRDKMFQPLRSGLASKPDLGSTYTPEEIYLDGNPKVDRPLFVQFCANDPEELLQAAQYVEPFCDAVDLNLGCPQGIARKGHYGAFLQEDQDLIYKLINRLHLKLSIPVTAKIRILESKEKTLEYAKRVLDAGASIITVHGRQRDQKGHKTGLADWTVLRYLRDHLPPETVIFANGNILRREDIDQCLKITGADAVMSAEGNLHDPTIFCDPPAPGEEGREYWRGRDGKGGYRVDAVMRRYIDIIYEHVMGVLPPTRTPLFLPSNPRPTSAATETATEDSEGAEPPRKKQKTNRNFKKEKSVSPNFVAMQPHLFRLLRPLVSKHHNVRDALARSRAGDIEAFENILQLVEEAVKHGLQEYEDSAGLSIAEPEELMASPFETLDGTSHKIDHNQSSVQTVKNCKRPWWICQPYVRPLPSEALEKGSLMLSKKDLAQLSPRERKDYEEKRIELEKRNRAARLKALPNSAVTPVTIENGRPEDVVPGCA